MIRDGPDIKLAGYPAAEFAELLRENDDKRLLYLFFCALWQVWVLGQELRGL